MKRLLPLLPLLVLAACGKHESTPQNAAPLPSVMVKVQTAKLEPHTATEEVVGTVRAKLHAAIEAKRDFWLAQADLDMALIGKPSLTPSAGPASAAGPGADAGH